MTRSARHLSRSVFMKVQLLRALSLAVLANCIPSAWSQELGGVWDLKVENLKHKVLASATISFSEKPAKSCMSGNWRRVVVESSNASDPSFFPIAEPLSFSVDGSKLTVGRNEVCDAYLHLEGMLEKGSVQGDYVSFGLSGGKRLGYFSAKQRQ
jgi:hypothetical protein